MPSLPPPRDPRATPEPSTPGAPPCPNCHSPKTLETFQHYGQRLYFCAECEHSWAVHPGRAVAWRRKPKPE